MSRDAGTEFRRVRNYGYMTEAKKPVSGKATRPFRVLISAISRAIILRK
jgi:hypothetical protein